MVCVLGYVMTHQAFRGPVLLPFRKYCPQGSVTGRMSRSCSMLELVMDKIRGHVEVHGMLYCLIFLIHSTNIC